MRLTTCREALRNFPSKQNAPRLCGTVAERELDGYVGSATASSHAPGPTRHWAAQRSGAV